MAEQVCPKCGVERITWWIDEEETPFTRWGCRECGYSAEEDEKHESDCPKCGSK